MSRSFIEITGTPPLNTVQDLGRMGYRSSGVGVSGMLDDLGLLVANALLGNEPGAAAIEVQMFPFTVRFTRDGAFALTGIAGTAFLDGQPVPSFWAMPVRAGQVLELRAVPRTAGSGVTGYRACLAVPGGIDVAVVLSSRSTHIRQGFGGSGGRQLAVGDVLDAAFDRAPTFLDHQGFGVMPPASALDQAPSDAPATVIRAIPAAEFDEFDDLSQQALWTEAWTVSLQSNRMGLRLDGEASMKRRHGIELRSHGIVPGVVQVPPSGKPIIQLRDGNTAGGYPKAAVVVQADLWKLAQLGPKEAIRFEKVTFEQARAAARENSRYLERVRSLAAICCRS